MKKLAVTMFIGYLVASAQEARAESPFTPFEASGPVLTIDEGDVEAAGQSGRFVVRDRHVGGVLFGADLPAEGAAFELTYDSNVPIATQSGQLHGTLEVDGLEANMHGTSSVGLTPVPCPVPDGVTCIDTGAGSYYPGLLVEGTFTFTDGANGNGDWDAWIIPILDAEGHILAVAAGALTLVGDWDQ